LGRVPGCGRQGEAHRGRRHDGAPTATEKRARAAADNGGDALACEQRGRGGREVCRCANEGGREGERGSGLKWPRVRRLRAPRATWAWSPRHARRLRGDGRADSSGPRAERAGKRARTWGRWSRIRAGPPGQREKRGKEGARGGMGQMGRKAKGAGDAGFFPFFFYSGICFPFSFYLLYLIQI
jgi:hypothetical protein